MSAQATGSFRAATLLLGALSASCVSGPEFASELHRRTWQATVDVSPAVQEIFGTDYYCEVAVPDDSIPGMAGVDASRQIIVFAERTVNLSYEELRSIAAHELAHVHMRGFWETLPASAQEGLAVLVAIQVVPNVRWIGPKEKEGYELVEPVGFSGVQALAKRAFQRGERVTIEQLQQIATFLMENLYRSPRVDKQMKRDKQIVIKRVEAYRSDPSLLPERHRERIDSIGEVAVIADYVAGMTDRFAMASHERLTV